MEERQRVPFPRTSVIPRLSGPRTAAATTTSSEQQTAPNAAPSGTRIHYASATRAGAWLKFVLFSGDIGWNPAYCSENARTAKKRYMPASRTSSEQTSVVKKHQLHMCEVLREALPGRHLSDYYFLGNNEEISLHMFLPGTEIGVHNGGSNTRLNVNLLLGVPDGETGRFVSERLVAAGVVLPDHSEKSSPKKEAAPSKRVSADPSFQDGAEAAAKTKINSRRDLANDGQLQLKMGGAHSFRTHAAVMAYDDCQDVEYSVAGEDAPVYMLQLGVMHPGLIAELETRAGGGGANGGTSDVGVRSGGKSAVEQGGGGSGGPGSSSSGGSGRKDREEL